jgi:hypothetical protein
MTFCPLRRWRCGFGTILRRGSTSGSWDCPACTRSSSSGTGRLLISCSPQLRPERIVGEAEADAEAPVEAADIGCCPGRRRRPHSGSTLRAPARVPASARARPVPCPRPRDSCAGRRPGHHRDRRGIQHAAAAGAHRDCDREPGQLPCTAGAPRNAGAVWGRLRLFILRDAAWLRECEVLYWGDIDTHGFRILDQLRAVHPHVESVLMDEETLLAHRDAWGRSRHLQGRP